jgi:endogenous inhibitor of DNA gyrase (YacG/DUF329 family)
VARLKCPTCERLVEFKDVAEVPDRPFCSERCRLIDLGKWFGEEYRISTPLENGPDPGVQPGEEDGDAG